MKKDAERDNRANQKNPTHDAYWKSRGWEKKPEDWRDRIADGRTRPDPAKNSRDL